MIAPKLWPRTLDGTLLVPLDLYGEDAVWPNELCRRILYSLVRNLLKRKPRMSFRKIRTMNAKEGERRSAIRYRMELDVRYRLIVQGEPGETGIGCTCDVSSDGILFTSDKPLAAGATI